MKNKGADVRLGQLIEGMTVIKTMGNLDTRVRGIACFNRCANR